MIKDTKSDVDSIPAVVEFLIHGVIYFVGLAIQVWVLLQLWSWFVAPTVGYTITVPLAVGAIMIAALFTKVKHHETIGSLVRHESEQAGSAIRLVSRITTAIVIPLLLVLVAWIVSLVI